MTIFQKTFPKRLETTNTIRQTLADLKEKNPLDMDAFVNRIEIIPNIDFAVKGKIEVFINRVLAFSNADIDNYFEDILVVNVSPESNEIKRNESVEIFIWNNIDSTSIKVTVNITYADQDVPPPLSSVAVTRERNKGTSDEGTKTMADGSPASGIVSTIYTCPANVQAKIIVCETRVTAQGSATQIRLLLRGQRIHRWEVDSQDPDDYLTTVAINGGFRSVGFTNEARKIWSNGSFPEHNKTWRDLVDEELVADETFAYDGNFSGNFNATIDFAYTVLETPVIA